MGQVDRRLFLLGGDIAVFEEIANQFIAAAGGPEAHIALLLQGRAASARYVPNYTKPLQQRGARRFSVVAPDASGQLDVEAAREQLGRCSGIIVGGGHTPTYARLYARAPLRSLLQTCYRSGVPVAGLSAGALILPDQCLLPAEERAGEGDGVTAQRVVRGAGLISGLLLAVHFDRGRQLPELVEGMLEAGVRRALGIEEQAYALLVNEELHHTCGHSVHEVVLTRLSPPCVTVRELSR